MNHLIISFISPDRPGLVDKLSNLIKSHQGNWQNSSLHYLSGFFSGVIEVAISAENQANLVKDLDKIDGFKCHTESASVTASNDRVDFILELTANDRAGIVQEISSVIHRQGGNLLKLVSAHDNAPHSGQDLFKAKATISVAADTVDNVIDALEDLADDLMVDISR